MVAERGLLAEGSVGVVVVDVVDDESCELVLVSGDGAVEELSSVGSDPAFGERVGDRGSDRGLEDVEAFGAEDLVERFGELAASVTHECSGIGESVGVAEEEVAGCLGGPGPGRICGHSGVEDFSAGDADDEAPDLGVGGRSTWGLDWLGAVAGDASAMPAQKGVGFDEPSVAAWPGGVLGRLCRAATGRRR